MPQPGQSIERPELALGEGRVSSPTKTAISAVVGTARAGHRGLRHWSPRGVSRRAPPPWGPRGVLLRCDGTVLNQNYCTCCTVVAHVAPTAPFSHLGTLAPERGGPRGARAAVYARWGRPCPGGGATRSTKGRLVDREHLMIKIE